MDLNSYLTDFFSLLNNNSNMRGGNNNMYGGGDWTKLKKDEDKTNPINFPQGAGNNAILAYYFKSVPADPDVSKKSDFLDAAKEKEFVANQVAIVEYMLDNGQAGGAMRGGGLKEQQALASFAAAALTKTAAVGVDLGVASGCGVVKVIQNNTEVKDMNWTESDFSDCVGKTAADLDVIIDQIIPIIKTRVSDFKGRILLRNRIGNRLLGKPFTDPTVKLFKNRLGNRFMGGAINTKLQI
jgi:hypothetical protein